MILKANLVAWAKPVRAPAPTPASSEYFPAWLQDFTSEKEQISLTYTDLFSKCLVYVIIIIFLTTATQHTGSLVPQPGIESMPSAVEAWSLNHWTTREVPGACYFQLAFLMV